MKLINTLRKECERVRALAVTSQLVGNTHRAQELDLVVTQLSILADGPWNVGGIERLTKYVGELADNVLDKDVQFAYREWYRSLVHITLATIREGRYSPA